MEQADGSPALETGRRTLIYFAIVHTQADMGALSESLRRLTVRRLGERGWRRQVDAVEKMWTEIEMAIDRLALSYEKVRVYQDGLPVCGRETDIVKDLAKVGSRNHQVLLRLMERGAAIMGTESSELLVEEYDLVKRLLEAETGGEMEKTKTGMKTLSRSLLRKRDEYIAERINGTLCGGETGILFLGMLHSVVRLLAEDIRVVYPSNRPLGYGGNGDDRKRRSGPDCGR